MKIMVFYEEGAVNKQKVLKSLLEWYCSVNSLTFVEFTRFCTQATTQQFVIENIHNYDIIVMTTEKRSNKTMVRRVANCPNSQFINYSTIIHNLNVKRYRKPVRFYMDGISYLDIPNINTLKIKDL